MPQLLPSPSFFYQKIMDGLNHIYNDSIYRGQGKKYFASLIEFNRLSDNVVTNSFMAKQWSQKLKEVNGSFYETHSSFLNQLIIKYVYSRLVLNPNLALYSSLLTCFFYSAAVYQQIEESKAILSGVYIIVNLKTEVCYIGKSWNIVNRFDEHCKQLIGGLHHNGGLQSNFNQYTSNTNTSTVGRIEEKSDRYFFYPFLLLLLEVGLVSDAERTTKEVQQIEDWPGLLYNIQYNNQKQSK